MVNHINQKDRRPRFKVMFVKLRDQTFPAGERLRPAGNSWRNLRRYASRRMAIVVSGLMAITVLLAVISKALNIDFAVLVEVAGVVVALLELLRRAASSEPSQHGLRPPR